jgi:hypothetical protein
MRVTTFTLQGIVSLGRQQLLYRGNKASIREVAAAFQRAHQGSEGTQKNAGPAMRSCKRRLATQIGVVCSR